MVLVGWDQVEPEVVAYYYQLMQRDQIPFLQVQVETPARRRHRRLEGETVSRFTVIRRD